LAPFALVLAMTTPARGDAGVQEYDAVIREAVREFDESHWEEARALFKRAHAQRPSARTWRGLGITAFELRQYVGAIHELESALGDPRKPLTEAQRRDVQALLVRARGFVSVLRLRVHPSGARVLLDGEPLSADEACLNPGAHALDVQAEGHLARTSQLNLEAGAQEMLEISLLPIAVPTPAPTEARPPPAPLPPQAPPVPVAPKRSRPFAWSLLGGAAVTAPAGLALYLAAAGKSRSVNDSRCQETEVDCLASVDAAVRRGERLAASSYALFGISGALILGGAAAFVFEGRVGRTHLSLGPRALFLTQKF
jgi:tetratricopeptide (TPR) repeat protein